MWSPQISREESRRRIQFIRDGLKGNRIRVKWNQPELSWLEGVFSRGDRKLTQVIVEAWKQGARYDAWGEHFRLELWEKAFRQSELDPRFYLYRDRSPDEVLPWDHIKSGVTKAFFKNEWERAQTQALTPDCREKCLECGVCDHKIVDPVLFRGSTFTDNVEENPLKILTTPSPKKYRLTFTKLNHSRFISHLELSRTFIRAFRRAGLDLAYSGGFHPMPRVSFICALPVGTESLEETLDIQLVESADTSYLKEAINRQLPEGIEVISVEGIPAGKKKAKLKESHFLITFGNAELNEDDLRNFLESDYFPVVKVTKKGEHSIDAKSLVKAIGIISSDKIKIVLKHTEGPQLKPEEIITAIFSLEDPGGNLRILKTMQRLK